MNILGEKVILRAIEPRDSEMLMMMINKDSIEYMVGGWSFPVSDRMQQEWIESLKRDGSELRCVIEIRKENKAIGIVSLTDIDYKNGNTQIHIKILDDEFRGRGYGSDAIGAMTTYAFNELRMHLIYSKINSYNSASKKLFEKCGFKFEGILRDRIYKKGEYFDILTYSIINEESK